VQNRFHPARDVQFSIDVMQMRFDGIGRDTELIGYFFIAKSAGRTCQNLTLSVRQDAQTAAVLVAALT